MFNRAAPNAHVSAKAKILEKTTLMYNRVIDRDSTDFCYYYYSAWYLFLMFVSNTQAGFKMQVLARFYLLTYRPVCAGLWSTYLSNKISPSGLCSCLFHLPRCFQTFYSCSKKSYQLQLMSANYIHDRNLSFSCTIFAKSQPPSKADASKTASESKSMCQVFDSSEKLIGVMTFSAAEDLARKKNLRLVSMGENQDGLTSFTLMSGHDLAQESMKQRKSEKTEKVKEKEFRLTSNISDHDLEIKIKQMKEVISRGDHIKLAIKGQKKLDGDQKDLQIAALLKKVTTQLQNIAHIKQAVRTANDLHLMLRPLNVPSSSFSEQE